ncbi:MAG TPA: hypothetical protein VHL10_06260 [Nitrososphaera sp.]|jgi:hypothetical protein|nr:hypothetical protein [Nitrososphaera sp.]
MGKVTSSELYFSSVLHDGDGQKTGEITILESLTLSWDDQKRKYRAANEASEASCVGYGSTHLEAVLDFLKARFGLLTATKVKYSQRVY